MNSVLEAIKGRRSVRCYEPKPIPRELLETIIDAGNWAPTGANFQPWRFVVVESEEFRQKLTEVALPTYEAWLERASEQFRAMRKPIDDVVEDPVYHSAPVILFVMGTSPNDCPMVCQNIMLAAYSLGIGSCWAGFGQMGVDDDMKAALELADDEQVYGPIVLGYPQGGFSEAWPNKEPQVKWL
jgi:nitroreductase